MRGRFGSQNLSLLLLLHLHVICWFMIFDLFTHVRFTLKINSFFATFQILNCSSSFSNLVTQVCVKRPRSLRSRHFCLLRGPRPRPRRRLRRWGCGRGRGWPASPHLRWCTWWGRTERKENVFWLIRLVSYLYFSRILEYKHFHIVRKYSSWSCH